jgi:phospholipid/cholesterol/gamma-HCH transport system substrate-binding protein
MAQRGQLTWSQLRVGLFVIAGLVVLAVGIMYVTGTQFFGAKYHLLTYLPEVSGLTTGAAVKVDGVEVGNVESVQMAARPASGVVDRNHNIEVSMRVNRDFQKVILTDSVASLVTEGLLGNRYVNIKRGLTGAQVQDHGVVLGVEEKAIKEVVERSAEVLGNLQALSQDVRDLIAGVQRGRGSLGKLLTDDQAYNHLNAILSKGDQIVSNVQAGQGSLGKLVVSEDLYTKAFDAVDRVDRMLANVEDQKGTIGKLLYDPSLYDNARQAAEKTNALLADVRAGKGTLGKLVNDDALYKNLNDTSAHLATATAKLNENTTTAGKMFSDPQMYDNLAGLAGDLRLLIGDFRQNPKKFLRIKLSIF